MYDYRSWTTGECITSGRRGVNAALLDREIRWEAFTGSRIHGDWGVGIPWVAFRLIIGGSVHFRSSVGSFRKHKRRSTSKGVGLGVKEMIHVLLLIRVLYESTIQ